MASLSIFLLLFLSFLLLAASISTTQSQKPQLARRSLLESDDHQPNGDSPIPKPKKKTPTFDSNNQTKPVKPKKSNHTSAAALLLTTSSASKPKLNKTLTLKPANTTKPPKSLLKPASKPANSTRPTGQYSAANQAAKKINEPANLDPVWLDATPDSDLDPDLLSEFRDLPTQIHDTLIPDLRKISITSKAYIYRAHNRIAKNVRPYVGGSNKFASQIALAASCLSLVLPLALLSLLLLRLRSHRFLIFVQAYLAVYFLTLALTALLTGLEPLRFFHATSPELYAWAQTAQTLGYLLFLLVQLIHMVVVFSGGESGRAVTTRMLALGEMMVGLAVGCHYYGAVFHRAVSGEPPRVNWKVHAVYAGCFWVVLVMARAESGKKVYEYDGGEDGKKN